MLNNRWGGGGALQLYNENTPQVDLYCDISVVLDPPGGGPRSTIYVTTSSNYPSWYAYWYDHDGYQRYYYNNPTYFEETNSRGPSDGNKSICHSVIVYDENNNVIASYNHPPKSGETVVD